MNITSALEMQGVGGSALHWDTEVVPTHNLNVSLFFKVFTREINHF